MSVLGSIVSSPVGKAVGKQLGVPQGARLRRGRDLPSGPVALGVAGAEGAGSGVVAAGLALLSVSPISAITDDPEARTTDADGRATPPSYAEKIGALVLDATAVSGVSDLEHVRALLRPAMRAVQASGRVVLIGTAPEQAEGAEAAAAQQALEGITRSVAKELRAGATANLIWIDPATAAESLTSTLSFLLQGRSAYVDGQPWRVGPGPAPQDVEPGTDRPFQDRVVVVTGAARGIGAAIARVFARDGAAVVVVDIPAAGQALAQVANEIGGSALQLDVTSHDAGQRIAAHVAARHGAASRIHTIVHNAGITRDKLLANTDEARWGSVLEVNLASQIRMNAALLEEDLAGGLGAGSSIVGVASTSGIAGNRGQTNYAASKAGVVGLVRAMAPEVAERGITVNAVAPGFIETEMTDKIPFATREFARRFNSLSQGGQPVDVAELIAYLADPASTAVTGQVIRVCGQSQIGA